MERVEQIALGTTQAKAPGSRKVVVQQVKGCQANHQIRKLDRMEIEVQSADSGKSETDCPVIAEPLVEF
jgi:hypothetical protein